jgi:hypothetical protein
VPFDQRSAKRAGDFVGKDGLAGAGLALDQQGTASVTAALTATFRSSVAT